MMTITITFTLLFAFGFFANSPLWAQSYPDASNTGWQHTGVTLQPYTGPVTITVDGTVIDSKDVKNCLTIEADNVVIRRSRVVANCIYALRLDGAANLLIEDTEVSCEGNYTAIAPLSSDSSYTARRIHGHDCENILFTTGDKALIEHSLVHETCADATGAHADTIQMFHGDSNITIRNNTIYSHCSKGGGGQNAALAGGYGLSNVLIEDNILAGGGYTLRLSEKGTLGTNVRVRNNKLSTVFYDKAGSFGPFNLGDMPDQLCGNTWYDGPNAGKLVAYRSNDACTGEDALLAPQNLKVM